MSTPFTLNHLKHFEAELKSPAQVRLLQLLAQRCAQMRDDGLMHDLDAQVRIKFDLLGLAYAINVYEIKSRVTVEVFGSILTPTKAEKDQAARRRVWECIKSGERFAQFNKPDEQGGRFAMVWFRLGGEVDPNDTNRAYTVTLGIHSDFVDAMVEYGRALLAAEEAEESGATS